VVPVTLGAGSSGILVRAPHADVFPIAFDAVVLRYQPTAAQRSALARASRGTSSSNGANTSSSGGGGGVEQLAAKSGVSFDECTPGVAGALCDCLPSAADVAAAAPPSSAALNPILPVLGIVAGVALLLCGIRLWALKRTGASHGAVGDGRPSRGSSVRLSRGSSADSATSSGLRADVGAGAGSLLRRLTSSSKSKASSEAGPEEPSSPSSPPPRIDPSPLSATADQDRVQLINVLRDPANRATFNAFVKDNFPSEPLLFYESIETYQMSADRRWRSAEAAAMISRYVGEGAPYRVQLSPALVAQLQTASTFPRTLFDEAKVEVYNWMQVNYLEAYIDHVYIVSHDEHAIVTDEYESTFVSEPVTASGKPEGALQVV
jgi:hypothetical protein